MGPQKTGEKRSGAGSPIKNLEALALEGRWYVCTCGCMCVCTHVSFLHVEEKWLDLREERHGYKELTPDGSIKILSAWRHSVGNCSMSMSTFIILHIISSTVHV